MNSKCCFSIKEPPICSILFLSPFSRCWICLWLWSWIILSTWPGTPPSWVPTTWTSSFACGLSTTRLHGMSQHPQCPANGERSESLTYVVPQSGSCIGVWKAFPVLSLVYKIICKGVSIPLYTHAQPWRIHMGSTWPYVSNAYTNILSELSLPYTCVMSCLFSLQRTDFL